MAVSDNMRVTSAHEIPEAVPIVIDESLPDLVDDGAADPAVLVILRQGVERGSDEFA